MVQRFNQEAQQVNLEPAAKSVGLTPDQLIIEASMAQAEAESVTRLCRRWSAS
jgi:cell division protein YceG involved in septum cleavage